MSTPSPLWLVDRSRIETGLECEHKRYLGYHFGPSGYGIQRKADSIPLTTGSAVHVGTQLLGQYCLAHPEARELPVAVIREAAATARAQYVTRARNRGIVGFADPERVEYLIGEQSALIGGLIWVAGLTIFPWLLDKYQVVEVEQEEVRIVGCTCGLTDDVGTLEEHQARECFGIGFMSKPDLLTRSRERVDSYQYFEFKTTSRVTKAWQDSWETKIQFHAGIVGVEKRLGIRVDETYVLGLYKGDRRENKDGVRLQNSVCCYGYRREAKPPLHTEAWEALYEDKARTPQRLDYRTWVKTPIWQVQFQEGIDPVEYWMRWLPREVREQQAAIVGPFNRQEVLIDGFFRELVPREQTWQRGVWEVYQALAEVDFEWSAPSVQQTLSTHFQRSWQCRKFGSEHECQFKPLCFQAEGWDDPLGGERYVLRRPHHIPELDAAIASGVLPPEDEYEQEED